MIARFPHVPVPAATVTPIPIARWLDRAGWSALLDGDLWRRGDGAERPAILAFEGCARPGNIHVVLTIPAPRGEDEYTASGTPEQIATWLTQQHGPGEPVLAAPVPADSWGTAPSVSTLANAA